MNLYLGKEEKDMKKNQTPIADKEKEAARALEN